MALLWLGYISWVYHILCGGKLQICHPASCPSSFSSSPCLLASWHTCERVMSHFWVPTHSLRITAVGQWDAWDLKTERIPNQLGRELGRGEKWLLIKKTIQVKRTPKQLIPKGKGDMVKVPLTILPLSKNENGKFRQEAWLLCLSINLSCRN